MPQTTLEAAESEDDQSDACSQAIATEDNEDRAEPHVEAAEPHVEALPPSQPDGGHSVAESLVDWGGGRASWGKAIQHRPVRL